MAVLLSRLQGRSASALVIALLLFAPAAVAQTDSLALSSGTAAANGAVPLNLTLTSPSGNEPASLQWTLTYPTAKVVSISATGGAASTSASKALTCSGSAGTYSCMVSGSTAGIISTGTVAVMNLTMAVGVTTTSIPITSSFAALPQGYNTALTSTGGVVTGGAWPSVSSLSCSPAILGSSSSSTCTVKLSGNASAGGAQNRRVREGGEQGFLDQLLATDIQFQFDVVLGLLIDFFDGGSVAAHQAS